PAAEANRIREFQKQAPAKFQATLAKLTGLSDKTHWLHLETPTPQCLPADQTGMKQDIFKYTQGTILCETAGKNEWLQTGEMIQLGLAGRIIDAPSQGMANEVPATAGASSISDPEVKKLLEELNKIDTAAPKGAETPGPNPTLTRYNLQRADLIERIV